MRRGLAIAAVAVCLLPGLAASNAPLWGDWWYDHQFHYLNLK